MQSFVVGPKAGAHHQFCRSQEVDIDEANADTEETAPLDERKNFVVGGDNSLGQSMKLFQDRFARSEMTQREFADDVGMNNNGFPAEERREWCRSMLSQMIDPN